MSTATLRAARPTDAGALGAMITEAVRDNAWKPLLHNAAQDIAHAGEMIDRGWVMVAEYAGRPRAFLAREDSYIHALFVTPDAQGHGLGRALLDTAKRQTRRLDLWTFADNHGARRFYRREGFTPTERPPASDEGLPEIHLTWTLDSSPSPDPAGLRAETDGLRPDRPQAAGSQPASLRSETPLQPDNPNTPGAKAAVRAASRPPASGTTRSSSLAKGHPA